MQSFTTLFEAIIAAEQSLNSEVALVEANGNRVVFSSKVTQDDKYSCIINDGYERHIEGGCVRMSKRVPDKYK
ncbi:hypothetical protein [Taibaiella helva]|uniref:hypothetical protein n=1 Tax=Taibaiella helva TaxID=2301235 RepID=UPI000E592081|nr:hypothetical protein [Taibaiella helva]